MPDVQQFRKKQRPPETRGVVTSLVRGLTLLEVFDADGTPEMSLGEISRRASLSKTTTFRLVRTLVGLGYLRQDPETLRYCLGSRVLKLGYALLEGTELKQIAFPYLKGLSEKCGETVNMAVLDGTELVYIERIKTQQIVNINLHIGSRLPLYNTSMGRALIAHQTTDWLRQYISKFIPDRAYTQNGGSKLLSILQSTREKGYSTNDEDLAPGLRSVATQIWNAKSEVAAAVNIAVPSARISLQRLEKVYAPQLILTAEAISAGLGYGHRQQLRRREI